MNNFDFEKEEWKDVTGYEGLYWVSSMGRLKTHDRYVGIKGGGKRLVKAAIFPRKAGRSERNNAYLRKDGKKKIFIIHRLVAREFCPNPDGKPIINHINMIPWDNRASNLEWCTYQENITHYLQNKDKLAKLKLNFAEDDGKRVGTTVTLRPSYLRKLTKLAQAVGLPRGAYIETLIHKKKEPTE